MGQNEAIQVIRERSDQVDNTRVYACLRAMRFSPIFIRTVENLKICIALHELKLPINTALLSAIREKEVTYMIASLHMLGDKKVLTLRRSEQGKGPRGLSWILSSTFTDLYYGKGKTE